MSNYINNKQKLHLKCLDEECGFEWYSTLNIIKDMGSGCQKCVGNIGQTYDEVVNYLFTLNIELLDKYYINNNRILNLKCKNNNCNNIWKTIFHSMKQNNSGCLGCKRYKNEKLTGEYIHMILTTTNIISQYKILTVDLDIRKKIS